MRTVSRGLAVLVGLASLLAASPASAVLIDFEGFGNVGTTGPAVTNQFAGVVFSSNSIFVNAVSSQPGIGAGLNFICTAFGSINCTQETILTFAGPVNGLSFLQVGDNQSVANTKVAEVDVFQNGVFSTTVDILGDTNFLNPNLVDLTAFNSITSIRIHAITDGGGLGWDNFNFTPSDDVVPSPVPEPTTLLLLASNLAGAGAVAWKRYRRGLA
jgi:hypothetical protein